MCAAIQRPGSILTFDYWDLMIAENQVFLRFKKFCAERFGHTETHYTLLNKEFIHEIQGYAPVEQTDIQKLEKRYTDSVLLKNYCEILPENYVVLQRK
jgi:hypothetical protein